MHTLPSSSDSSILNFACISDPIWHSSPPFHPIIVPHLISPFFRLSPPCTPSLYPVLLLPQNWELAARRISAVANGPKIVVEKSTLPVRTAHSMKRVLQVCCLSSFVSCLCASSQEFKNRR